MQFHRLCLCCNGGAQCPRLWLPSWFSLFAAGVARLCLAARNELLLLLAP